MADLDDIKEDLLDAPEEKPAAEPEAAAEPSSEERLMSELAAVREELAALRTKEEPEPEVTEEPEVSADAPLSWAELRKEQEEKAKQISKETYEQIQREQEQVRAAEADERKKLDEYVDGQLAEIDKAGYMAPVTDIKNPEDPGVRQRKELFDTAMELKTDNLVAVAKFLHGHRQARIPFSRPNTPPTPAPVSPASQRAQSPQRPAPAKPFRRMSLDEVVEYSNEFYKGQ